MTKKSFNQIVPLWNKKLKKGFSKAVIPCEVDGKTLNIGNYTQCIVGEAYKFTPAPNKTGGYSVYDGSDSEQYCDDCRYFANKFDNVIEDLAFDEESEHEDLEDDKERFETLKKQFVNHWNEVHENN